MPMLVLVRRSGESFRINRNAVVRVVTIGDARDRVKLRLAQWPSLFLRWFIRCKKRDVVILRNEPFQPFPNLKLTMTLQRIGLTGGCKFGIDADPKITVWRREITRRVRRNTKQQPSACS